MAIPTSALPFVVIGAGIAGLATAKSLASLGHHVVVLEQSPKDREQGYAITLRSWAYEPLIAALDDTLEHFIQSVVTDRAVGGRGHIDTSIHDIKNNEIILDMRTKSEGDPLRANRNALREYLSRGIDVRYDSKVVALQCQDDYNELRLESGEVLQANFVIAADGIFSSTRQRLLPNVKPALVPSKTYQGQLLVSRSDFDAYIGPNMNSSNVIAAVADNILIGIQVVDYRSESVQMAWNYIGKDDEQQYTDDSIRRNTIEADEVVKSMAGLEAALPYSYFFTPERLEQCSSELFHWNMHAVSIGLDDLQGIARKSRVCFLGDAAHGMPIFAGEGGNHAIVDAIELTKQIESSDGAVITAVEDFLLVAHGRWQSAVQRSTEHLSVLCKPVEKWKAIAAATQNK